MVDRTPLVVVLAGPNGAGKSTAAAELLQGALAVDEFVNADTIAQGLSAYRPDAVAIAAGRVMLERLRFLEHERWNFAFESTLSGRGHARWLQRLRSTGYLIHLVFLSLPDSDLAVARVAERVRKGGHAVPEDVVRLRFMAGIRNFFTIYRDCVDAWQVYDNSDVSGPRLIASGAARATAVIADEAAWEHFQEEQA